MSKVTPIRAKSIKHFRLPNHEAIYISMQDDSGATLSEAVLTQAEAITLSHSLWCEVFGDVPEEVAFQ